MDYFNIPQDFVEFIKQRARNQKNEIYGWLIGYTKNGICNIIALSECSKFKEQSQINAIPDSKEFYEISSILPQGIGPIGIYHSHPLSKEIFMSTYDIDTLSNLNKKFSKAISIVTNGDKTKSFQITEKNEIKELRIQNSYPTPPRFISFELDEKTIIKVDKGLLEKYKSKIKQLKALISNEIVNFFYKNWSKLNIIYKSEKLSNTNKINSYLGKNFKQDSLIIDIPEELKENGAIKFLISEKKGKTRQYSTEGKSIFKFCLKAKIPIYIVENNLLLEEIINSLKTELISNNLLRKIFNAIIDLDSGDILIPSDMNIRFFGFYINLLAFKNQKLNKLGDSNMIFSFFQKNYPLFLRLIHKRSYSINQIREDINQFLEDFNTIADYFPWKKEIKNKIKNLKNITN